MTAGGLEFLPEPKEVRDRIGLLEIELQALRSVQRALERRRRILDEREGIRRRLQAFQQEDAARG